jgi:glyoxylate utilization-related uncharacterized protein
VLEEGPGYKIKRIAVKPKASLSLQLHRHRSEHWVVISGEAEVVRGEQGLLLHANESSYIPAGAMHRLANGNGRPGDHRNPRPAAMSVKMTASGSTMSTASSSLAAAPSPHG